MLGLKLNHVSKRGPWSYRICMNTVWSRLRDIALNCSKSNASCNINTVIQSWWSRVLNVSSCDDAVKLWNYVCFEFACCHEFDIFVWFLLVFIAFIKHEASLTLVGTYCSKFKRKCYVVHLTESYIMHTIHRANFLSSKVLSACWFLRYGILSKPRKYI